MSSYTYSSYSFVNFPVKSLKWALSFSTEKTLNFPHKHSALTTSYQSCQPISLLRSSLSQFSRKYLSKQSKSSQSHSQIKSEHTSGQEKRNFRHGKSPETMKAVVQAASQSAATTPCPVRFRQQAPPHSQGPQRGFLYTSSCRHRSPPRQQLASQQLGTAPRPGPPYLHFNIILEETHLSSLQSMQSNRSKAALTRLRKS